MENLLESVEEEIRSYHIFSKPMAVGSEDGNYWISFERFREIAADIECNAYDEYNCVADDMVVLFEDGSWLDTSFEETMSDTEVEQQWQYHIPPIFAMNAKPFTHMITNPAAQCIHDLEERKGTAA
jgi:hypothetical protein